MITWETLARARIPGASEELVLRRRGAEYSINIQNWQLMNSRQHASEDALAELACDEIRSLSRPHLLIGGLGMGFTLAAALARIGAGGRITVAELVPEVIEWNRGLLGPLAGHPLRDRRVRLLTRDVIEVIRAARAEYDAILLDVDNGPRAAIREPNHWLYTDSGLIAAAAALRPSGALAIWEAGRSPLFARNLRRAGFVAREVPVRAHSRQSGQRHGVWIARPRRPDEPARGELRNPRGEHRNTRESPRARYRP